MVVKLPIAKQLIIGTPEYGTEPDYCSLVS